MRLDKIKLAGFKSFVDPMTIDFRSNLVAILGPNGCGKSNVIDAVRWVMGESSAKQLRGDSSTDVIFSGSQNRKPVGQASVELIFDNSDGTIGGEYAGFSEIAIRRVVDREGISQYYLNGTKCRRKDITDIFLGTGLGPRSYSVIEQGMISRFIEAKPEDVRVFLEEAAGISKYKERRRETENRIKHTRENLDRLSDLRQELEKQLNHLERQSEAAVKFKAYKAEERLVNAQLLAICIKTLDEGIQHYNQIIQNLMNEIESHNAQLSSLDTNIEKAKLLQIDRNDALNEVQKNYYQLGAEIAKQESAIQHLESQKIQLQSDKKNLEITFLESQEQETQDRINQVQLQQQLTELAPSRELAQTLAEESGQLLEEAELAQQTWQAEWDSVSERAQLPGKEAEVQKTHISHLEQQHRHALARVEKLGQEKNTLSVVEQSEKLSELGKQLSERTDALQIEEERLETYETLLDTAQTEQQQIAKQWDESKQDLQVAKGKLASLEALQQQLTEKNDDRTKRWLSTQGLASAPTVLQQIKVNPGWEHAIEVILGDHLQGRCLENWQDYQDALDFALTGLSLVSPIRVGSHSTAASSLIALSDQVTQGREYIQALLAQIYCASDCQAAQQALSQLPEGASVVTPDGAWFSQHWLRLPNSLDQTQSVIRREEEIHRLRAEVQRLEQANAALHAAHQSIKTKIEELSVARKTAQQAYHVAFKVLQELKSEQKALQSRIEEKQGRQQRVAADIAALEAEMRTWEQQSIEARAILSEKLDQMTQISSEKEALLLSKETVLENLTDAKVRAKEHHQQAQTLQVEFEKQSMQLKNYTHNLVRMEAEIQRYQQQLEKITQQLEAQVEPALQLQTSLHALVNERAQLEQGLSEARKLLGEANEALQQADFQKNTLQAQVSDLRQQLEREKMNWQADTVRHQTLLEQLQHTEYPQVQPLLDQLPPEATKTSLEALQEQLNRRIDRLGPINLAAIEEFEVQRERKVYLDQQNADLVEALEVLEQAIRKIDRETRDKFKETFDIVANNFHTLFPQLFGGGHAKLELTGDDLLETGVSVMACPPGKRNQLISQLSGGEKALTAVALVFSIFKLNPAPFCLLDEVDAPLDDANVARFCNMVKTMADAVQFIFISHNKLTMELADYLIGVTMKEPGVSRFVSVDLAEAVRLVEDASTQTASV